MCKYDILELQFKSQMNTVAYAILKNMKMISSYEGDTIELYLETQNNKSDKWKCITSTIKDLIIE